MAYSQAILEAKNITKRCCWTNFSLRCKFAAKRGVIHQDGTDDDSQYFGVKMKKRKLADLLDFKTNLLEILAIAVIVALGVNVFSTGFVGFFNVPDFNALVVGGVSIFIGALLIIRNVKPINSGVFKFEAAICVDKESKELIPIEGYPFAEETSRFVKAICTENKAIHKLWTEDPIGSTFSFNNGKPVHKTPKSNLLLIEAVEYFVLRSLSLHLNSYFIKNDLSSGDELTTLERKNIPSVLLENRYLELFSKPMEEREAFIKHGDGPSHGKVVYAFGKDGVIFDHFDLMLPKGSSVTRETNSSISIKTDRFNLNIHPKFEGMGSNFPHKFQTLYLGRDFRSVSTLGVELIITVEFSAKALLTTKGWSYYWWLDSFLERIEESLSKNSFLEKISWYQNAAMMHMAENRRKQQIKEQEQSEKNG